MTQWLRLMSAHAAAVGHAFRQLEEFLENPSAGAASRLNVAVKQAESRAEAVEKALDKSTVDGVDREAVFLTVRALEDMTIRAKNAAEEMLKFRVESDRYVREMARAASAGCASLVGALNETPARRKHAGELLVEAKRAYRQLVQLYRRARAINLKHPNAVESMKVGAIYTQLYEVAHGGDGAAEAVGNMLVKSGAKA